MARTVPLAVEPVAASPRDVRREIQALRALAVLLVVGFHLWPGRLPGGYIGVDVFFVISGYLITAHLMREVDATGRVGLAHFWARRARRLLPAAYLVLAVTALGIVLWMPVGRWTENFIQLIGSALYVENWVLAARAVDYLAADNDPSAVQNYWTLSVEEQFYLVWPLLVLLGIALAARVGRGSRTGITIVLAAATAATFAYSLWVTATNPALAYFSTPARAWQFGAGALFALWEIGRHHRRVPAAAAVAVSWAGVAAIVACALIYDESTAFPGTAALVPTIAALAVIWARLPAGRLSPAPLMAWRPVQTTGDISYSMYLWHWPPIILLPEALGHDLGLRDRVLVLLGTFAAAWLTYRYVEAPVRGTRRFGLRRPLVTGLATLTAAAVLVGGSAWGWQQGRTAEREAVALTARLNDDMPRCFGAASMDPEKPCVNPDLAGTLVPTGVNVALDFADYPQCWSENTEVAPKSCTFGDPTDTTIPHLVLVGDSHVRAMLPAFIRLSEAGLLSFTALLKGGCPLTTGPLVHLNSVERERSCPVWQRNVQGWITQQRAEIDTVLVGGYAKLLGGSDREATTGLVRAWEPITAAGIPVVALTDNPYHERKPSTCLARETSWDETTCSVRRDDAFPFGDPFGAAAAQLRGVESLDLTEFYCTRTWCPSVIGGVNVYRDNSHLTTTYTRTLAPFVWRGLNRAGVTVGRAAPSGT